MRNGLKKNNETYSTTCMTRVLSFRNCSIGSSSILLVHKISLIRSEIGMVDPLDFRILIIFLEFHSCLRYRFPPPLWIPDFVVPIGRHSPTECIGNRHEKVGCSLPICRHVSHVDKILSCKACRAKINHPSFVNEANFVERFIKRFSGLVN